MSLVYITIKSYLRNSFSELIKLNTTEVPDGYCSSCFEVEST